MITVLLKFILSHIIGDFVLQNNFLVQKRKENVFYLILHILIHLVVMLGLFYNNLPEMTWSIALVTCTHLTIDSLKIWIERQWNFKPILLFCIDQILHLGIICAVVFNMYGFPQDVLSNLLSNQSLVYFIGILLLAVVSPIFLRLFFSRWNTVNEFQEKRNDTLQYAGTMIGIMERLIIVFFIQINFLEGIGFLLAAKSIFRFGDLANAKDTKFTEYVLLGTLMSFVIAIVIGFGIKYVISYL